MHASCRFRLFIKGSILTQSLVVFDLVPLPTEQSGGGFLEEAFRGTGDVEIGRGMAAARWQTLWTEALWKKTEKWVSLCYVVAVVVGGGGVGAVKLPHGDIYREEQTDSGGALTWVKKSCLRMRSRSGLSSGILASKLAMSCFACGDSEDGRE